VGLCDLCGEKAGWFQSRHPACNIRAEDLRRSLQELVFNGTLNGKGHAELETEAKQFATEKRLPFAHFHESLLQGANDAASQIAVQSPITEDELNRLVNLLEGFGITGHAAEYAQRRWFGMAQLGMSHTLWQVLHDITPFYDGTGRMQFNLQSGEVPIFSTGKATYAEERTISNRARTFEGLSIPVGGGIYYHVGGSQQGNQQASGLLPLDEGEILITNRTLYFGGQRETLRVPLNHVVRYQFYVDGVGVCESHGPPKVFIPDYSGMDTGWFFFSLLSAVTNKLSQ
jgi:hypothetical protein